MFATRPPVRRRFIGALALSLALGVAAGACGDDDDGADGGFDSPRDVVDAHVTAAAAYDLSADCSLRHPDAITEMAEIDQQDPDGYCDWATAPLLSNATAEEKARTKAIYTDATITAGTAGDDQAAFSLEAADGSYHEDIVVVRLDGRWWLESAEGSDSADAHEH